MKKVLSLFLVCLLLVCAIGCGNGSDDESKSASESVPKSVLDSTLSKARYRSDPFSISVGELVNSTMTEYKVKYLKCDEAIENGYLKESQIGSEVNKDKFYFAIISGEAMVNPDLPYMTEYEEEAITVWMIFNDDNELMNSGVDLCSNLEVCAIMLMTRSY